MQQVLPPEFDADYYRQRYPDVSRLDAAALLRHFTTVGAMEGRQGSASGARAEFFALLKPLPSVLEIGPFCNPSASGRNVKYFDVLGTPELRARAAALGMEVKACPAIDFVSPTGDLAVVTAQFDALVSSHSIEHQPDLVRHLQEVSRLLLPHGKYFLAVPDKRYCFDHFLAESSIADVLDAHVAGRRTHSLASVIEHRALTTHNDAARHWRGDHGEEHLLARAGVVRAAANEFTRAEQSYVDVHAWQFTPASFGRITKLLFELHLSNLNPTRIFPTTRGSNEFFAVLEKSTQEVLPLHGARPSAFDAEAYYQANPDVRRAGVDAESHYLKFGAAEGRKLRP